MITVQKEEFKSCHPELEALFLEQLKENEPELGYELDINEERYEVLDYLGHLHLYTARLDSGEIVGYLMLIVDFHLHHQTKLYAFSDVIYVAPEYRRSSVGSQLIEESEKILKDYGVEKLIITMKIKQQFRNLLAGLGFEPSEELWEKSI